MSWGQPKNWTAKWESLCWASSRLEAAWIGEMGHYFGGGWFLTPVSTTAGPELGHYLV